jgi:ParB-like chromosome segregation protein Spo0J
MSTLTITTLPVGSLKPNPRNPRTHSKAQIKQIARSIEAFGFIGAVLVDAGNRIIAGHGRVEAAKLLKMERHRRRRHRHNDLERAASLHAAGS